MVLAPRTRPRRADTASRRLSIASQSKPAWLQNLASSPRHRRQHEIGRDARERLPGPCRGPPRRTVAPASAGVAGHRKVAIEDDEEERPDEESGEETKQEPTDAPKHGAGYKWADCRSCPHRRMPRASPRSGSPSDSAAASARLFEGSGLCGADGIPAGQTGRRVDVIALDGGGRARPSSRSRARWTDFPHRPQMAGISGVLRPASISPWGPEFPQSLLPADVGLIIADDWSGSVIRPSPVFALNGRPAQGPDPAHRAEPPPSACAG